MSDKNSNMLTAEEIARAWKDEEFRNSLTEEQRAALPPAPTALGELSDEELEAVAGGCACACNKKMTMTSTAAEL